MAPALVSSPQQPTWHDDPSTSTDSLTKTAFLINAEQTPAMARIAAEEESDRLSDIEESDLDSYNASETHSQSLDDDVETPTKRQRIRALGQKIKSVPHRVLMRADIVGQAQPQMDADNKDIPGVTDNPNFNVGLLADQPQHGTIVSIASKATEVFGDAKQFIAHPVHKAKRTAASSVTVSEAPYLSQDADNELIKAHDELDEARDRAAGAHTNSTEPESDGGWEVLEKKHKIHELEARRETLKSAWATAKHVRRVKAVRLPFVGIKPKEEDFNEFDDQGNFVRWKWEMYIGRLALWHMQDFTAQHIDDTNDVYFTREELLRQTERLLVASSPIQTFLMHLHKVSLWEDPMLTLRWVGVWLFMIKTGYISCILYGYMVYNVLGNRHNQNTLSSIREAQERAASGGRPYKISELVDRHGDEHWLEPLMDELGPIAQIIVGDAADLVEKMINFYSWKDPSTTRQSLVLWSSLTLFTATCSSEYGLKIMLFALGMIFFMIRPVTSRYPRFRRVLSPSYWCYYDVPTNAELAFKGLQEDAQKAKERMFNIDVLNSPRDDPNATTNTVKQPSATSPHHPTRAPSLHKDDILHFRGSCDSHLGHLVITPTHIRFTRTLPQQSLSTLTSPIPSASQVSNDIFNHPYLSLLELRKTSSSMGKLFNRKELISTEALVLVWTDGTTDTIHNMRKRDEAFNTIIGFSGLRFKVQQPLEGTLNGGPNGVTQGTGIAGRRTAEDEKRERGIDGDGSKAKGNTYGGARELGLGHNGPSGGGREANDRNEADNEGPLDKLKRKIDTVIHKSDDNPSSGNSGGGGSGGPDAGDPANMEKVVYLDGEPIKGDPRNHQGGSVIDEIGSL